LSLNDKLKADKTTMTGNRRDHDIVVIECNGTRMQDFRYSRSRIFRHLDQESRFDETTGTSRDCNKDHARNITILYLAHLLCGRFFSRYYRDIAHL